VLIGRSDTVTPVRFCEQMKAAQPDAASEVKLVVYPRCPHAFDMTLPDRVRDVLATAYGIIGVVRKRRTVRMVDRTRVHLDEVEGLGTFVELEVVLGDGEPAESGVVEARRLMAALGIQEDQLVSRAYIDLLQSR
jgi:hypothetical protein